jgi:hypothetical protein
MKNKVKNSGRVFANDIRTIRRVFERQGANIARELQNPRLLRIRFQAFRHYEYAKKRISYMSCRF